jgi:alanine racemase
VDRLVIIATMPLKAPPAPLRLTIDHRALAANWRALDRLSGAANAGAAVKADGYGTGARQVVPVLAEAGCRNFFVAHWSEAAEISDLVDPKCISVLHGPLTNEDAVFAQTTGIRPVINSVRQARLWLDAGGGVCDLMVDTGINRLGLPMSDIADDAVSRLRVEVVMSHLASADEDSPFNETQRQRWEDVRRKLNAPRASLANSAGIMLGRAYHGELTRPGLALYGGVPRPELAPEVRQVAQPEAAIMQVRNLSAGDSVGYNSTFTATQSMRVGVIALGYADGYLRAWSGKGAVHARGARLPVLGRVSMDMTVIDLSSVPELAEGDWVQVDYSLPEASSRSELSQYELLTLLGRRFGR